MLSKVGVISIFYITWICIPISQQTAEERMLLIKAENKEYLTKTKNQNLTKLKNENLTELKNEYPEVTGTDYNNNDVNCGGAKCKCKSRYMRRRFKRGASTCCMCGPRIGLKDIFKSRSRSRKKQKKRCKNCSRHRYENEEEEYDGEAEIESHESRRSESHQSSKISDTEYNKYNRKFFNEGEESVNRHNVPHEEEAESESHESRKTQASEYNKYNRRFFNEEEEESDSVNRHNVPHKEEAESESNESRKRQESHESIKGSVSESQEYRKTSGSSANSDEHKPAYDKDPKKPPANVNRALPTNPASQLNENDKKKPGVNGKNRLGNSQNENSKEAAQKVVSSEEKISLEGAPLIRGKTGKRGNLAGSPNDVRNEKDGKKTVDDGNENKPADRTLNRKLTNSEEKELNDRIEMLLTKLEKVAPKKIENWRKLQDEGELLSNPEATAEILALGTEYADLQTLIKKAFMM